MKAKIIGTFVGGAYNTRRDVQRVVVHVKDKAPMFCVSGRGWCAWNNAYSANTYKLTLLDDPGCAKLEVKIRAAIRRFESADPAKAVVTRKKVAASLLNNMLYDNLSDDYVKTVLDRARLTLVNKKNGTQYIRLKKGGTHK